MSLPLTPRWNPGEDIYAAQLNQLADSVDQALRTRVPNAFFGGTGLTGSLPEEVFFWAQITDVGAAAVPRPHGFKQVVEVGDGTFEDKVEGVTGTTTSYPLYEANHQGLSVGERVVAWRGAGDYYLCFCCGGGGGGFDYIFDNVTVTVTNNTVWNVDNSTYNYTATDVVYDEDSTFVFEGHFELCGLLAWCYYTFPAWSTDQHDLAQPDPEKIVYRISSTTGVELTGIVPNDMQLIALTNVGAYPVTLTHDDANSAAANRFYLPQALDMTLEQYDSAVLWYDPVQTRWKVLADTLVGEGGGTDTDEKVKVSSTDTTADGLMGSVGAGKLEAGPGVTIVKTGGGGYERAKISAGGDNGPGASPVWMKFAFDYTDFDLPDTSTSLVIYGLPARGCLHGVVIKCNTQFATGGSMISLNLEVRVDGGTNIVGVEGFLAVSNTNFDQGNEEDVASANADKNIFNWGVATDVFLDVTGDGLGDLDELTAGAVDVWLLVSLPPA